MALAAQEKGVPVHLDGARIFNAAFALGVNVKELAAPVDSVMFCLSKGLGAPVGSLLAGNKKFVERARKNRKVLGGGLRQSGILAAAGIVALEKMVSRLAEDHKNTRVLAEGLAQIPGIAINPEEFPTNIILFSIKDLNISASKFVKLLAEQGVLGNAASPFTVRFVTHKDVSINQIQDAIRIVEKLVKGL